MHQIWNISDQNTKSLDSSEGVLDFLLDRTALWVGVLRKVGIDLQLRHIGLYRVA